jgi:hypothetical protein
MPIKMPNPADGLKEVMSSVRARAEEVALQLNGQEKKETPPEKAPERPPVVLEKTRIDGDRFGKTETEEEVSKKPEETPPEKTPGQGKLIKFKADGKEHEAPMSEVLRLASMGKHAEPKLAEANKAKLQAQNLEKYLSDLLQNPKRMREMADRQAALQGIDFDSDPAYKPAKDDVEYEELSIAEDDTEKEIQLTKALNSINKKYAQMEKLLRRQVDQTTTRDLKSEFDSKRVQYGIPENASGAIAAFMKMGEDLHRNSPTPYTMDCAMNDYLKFLPDPKLLLSGAKPDESIVDAIKNNESLDRYLKGMYVEEYNTEELKRQENSTTIKDSGKPPEPREEEPKEEELPSLSNFFKAGGKKLRKKFGNIIIK